MGQQFLRGTIPILPEQGQDPMVLVSPMVLGTTFQLRVFHGSSTRTMNQDLGQQGKGMDWRGRGSCLVLLHPCLGLSFIPASASPASLPQVLLHSHLLPSPSLSGQARICPQLIIPGVLSRAGRAKSAQQPQGHLGVAWP